MAKKKAVKKKASKKKASKKKASKKKTAKKSASKKMMVPPVTLTYSCNGTCGVDDRNAHLLAVGNTVFLKATNTDVTIDFTEGTPFDVTHIHILPHRQKRKIVMRTGDYEYELSCGSCPSSFTNPKMIVP